MIRRKKTTVFTDAKDNTTVKELKQMIEGETGWRLVGNDSWNMEGGMSSIPRYVNTFKMLHEVMNSFQFDVNHHFCEKPRPDRGKHLLKVNMFSYRLYGTIKGDLPIFVYCSGRRA